MSSGKAPKGHVFDRHRVRGGMLERKIEGRKEKDKDHKRQQRKPKGKDDQNEIKTILVRKSMAEGEI